MKFKVAIGQKERANICALFGEEAFKASGRRREDGRELGRKRMRSEREVKTPSRPNNNSAQRWRMEEWRDEEEGKVYESCSEMRTKNSSRENLWGNMSFGRNTYLKKNPGSEWRKEGGGGLLAFRRRWERNDKTEGKGGGRVGGERGEVKVRGDEETEGADKKRDVAEDKHYL